MYKLPELSYKYSDLEPYIDSKTMEIHHSKHHQGYIDKLNAALEKYPSFAKASEGKSEMEVLEHLLKNLTTVPEEIRATVRNNGGGHVNHSLFWKIMAPLSGHHEAPAEESKLAKMINRDFGGFEKFKEEFSDAASKIFGSGWAWLVYRPGSHPDLALDAGEGSLSITTTPNQDSPISEGLIPLIGLDVWEHAYYLKYQNRRSEYIENWWHIVDWSNIQF